MKWCFLNGNSLGRIGRNEKKIRLLPKCKDLEGKKRGERTKYIYIYKLDFRFFKN